MDYQGTIIRPPSEADSILLQVTLGCSHGKCAFCGAYQDKPFAFKDMATIRADIEFAARHRTRQRRVFLCDGDAMILPQDRLREILHLIRERIPRITRVGAYANAKSLARKTDEQLRELRELGLGMVYMGLESGDDEVLRRMNKHGDAAFITAQGRRARKAGFRLNVTAINGLGGVEGSLRHARKTARVLSEMDPDQAALLTLMLIPGTPLHAWHEAGDFVLPDSRGILLEIREILANLHLSRGVLLANHASNYLPLKVRLPSGRQAALDALDAALATGTGLRPDSVRRL
ncbi:radical SAM protein [Pseudodesulfovibrio tunisiensis]|uniref:radical SAM protein n=1 Tax=Pseudodesulfovibrio tunisiensis TaxID=463192 RepID=UPI001FB4AAC5|nr:radical SAM protein [Pseudodesulfovibrio tunisiensis]